MISWQTAAYWPYVEAPFPVLPSILWPCSRCPGRTELRCGRYGICYVTRRCRSKGSDPNRAKGQSRYRVYLPPMIREVATCNSEMLQWPLALWLTWLCVFFLRTSEIIFLYLKLPSGENKLLIWTFGNSKYSELKWKIKVTGQTWGRKILQL